jgi:hypothetical protein
LSPSADHALTPSAANHLVSVCVRRFGHPQADARHHLHVLGLTGTGKSTWLAGHALVEAAAGRGIVLIDCQGELARHVITRLPTEAEGHIGARTPASATPRRGGARAV